jgi:hypothetical protein
MLKTFGGALAMFVILGKPVANVNTSYRSEPGIQSVLSNHRNTSCGLSNCVTQGLQAPLVTSQANQPSNTNNFYPAKSFLSNYPLDTHEKFRFLRFKAVFTRGHAAA